MHIWVMRDKASEWKALKALRAAGAADAIPFVEAVCEPYFPQGNRPAASPIMTMRRLADNLAAIADGRPVWVDLGHLTRVFSASDVAQFHSALRGTLGAASRNVIPVIRTSSPAECIAAALDWALVEHSGVCVRIEGVTHIEEKVHWTRNLLETSEIEPRDTDVVVDAQDLPRVLTHRVLRDMLPEIASVRTWGWVAGTFPPSITALSPDEYEHSLERPEWDAWRSQVEDNDGGRSPIYGDYATQPAIYSRSPGFAGSPTVRYSTTNAFMILRGRGGHGTVGADYLQYIGHALYLRAQPYFRDLTSTLGDLYVDRIATGSEGTGNLTTWRIASLQRHAQLVAAQMALVPVPLRVLGMAR